MRQDAYTTIPVENLKPYKNHPFKEYTGETLEAMVDSIREYGIINPIIVRRTPRSSDIYEIISGHNRVKAAKIAQLTSVPAIIKEMDNDTADLLVTESNFKQRNDLLPSEKGKAYKMQLEAIKRQGERNDLSSVQFEHRLGRAQVAGMNNEKPSQIQRYIRLTFLIPKLLDAVDDEKIPFTPAVNISHLRKSEQQILHEILSKQNTKLTIEQSLKLKETSSNHILERDEIISILEAETNKKKKPVKAVKVPFKSIEKYFEGQELTEDEILDRIIKALDNYSDGQ